VERERDTIAVHCKNYTMASLLRSAAEAATTREEINNKKLVLVRVFGSSS
jgi:hypothetical protein